MWTRPRSTPSAGSASARSASIALRVDRSVGRGTMLARPDQGGRHVVEIAVEDRAGGIAAQRFELAVQVGDPAPAALAP